MKNQIVIFLYLISLSFLSKASLIPDTIRIGNVQIAIHSSAKPIFEKEISLLGGTNKKFSISLLEKMRLYFPIIEPILKEGNIPDEFKYVCVQESALNANAVSTSAAVGYWQFKKETAKDVGLKVDLIVDERRHIISSTQGAVQYFNRNNTVLNNWMSTLLSYRLGLGSLKKTNYASEWAGQTIIQVDSSTDWYILRFLAYKEFWSEKMAQEPILTVDNTLIQYEGIKGKNLYELSDDLKISYDDLKKHNAWILKDWIPDDKNYTLYHPKNLKTFISNDEKPFIEEIGEPEFLASVDTTKLYRPPGKNKQGAKKNIMSDQVEITNHLVVSGDNLSYIASQYGMKLSDLLALNNISMNTMIQLGQKIKVSRKIPMLEIMAKKLDQKSQNSSLKKIEVVEKDRPKILDESVRKIETREEKNSFYIAPAESREITMKADLPRKTTSIQTDHESLKIQKKLSPEPVEEELKVETESPTELKSKFHVVQAGETLFRIAKMYQCLISELIQWNNLGKNPAIKIGQKIKLTP